MKENQILEKLWREAQAVEAPEELSPERIRERIEAEQKTVCIKNKREKRERSRRAFRLRFSGGRAASAAAVLAVTLFACGVAGSQPPVTEPIAAEEPAADEASQTADIQLAETADDTEETEQEEAAAEVVKELGSYHLAESYEEVYEMLTAYLDVKNCYNYIYIGAREDAATDMEQEAFAAEDVSVDSYSISASAADAGTDYSTTNLQVTGVDESDIVKTDGSYIYIAADDTVQIVDVRAGEPRQLSGITPELSGNLDRIREMYVADGRLLLIVQVEESDGAQADTEVYFGAADVDYGISSSFQTQLLTYDITDPADARLIGSYEQEGSYVSSRKIGDQVYLFTRYSVYTSYTQTEDESVSVRLPAIQGQTIPEDCIYLPEDGSDAGVLISSVDVKNPETATDQKLVFNGSASLYVTDSSIYLYQNNYNFEDERGRADLTRFKLDGGKITADCAEAVWGYVEDTFAIHESADGYLYVLTTSYSFADGQTTNQIYVLDERLKIYGRLEELAVGETVYAARFVDDIGYFVTYRNTDPLFTVDFSDPANPAVIGELELPGFSDYLQFWDDEHLIGVGAEYTEDGVFVGIKVSLYDISDPTDVRESAKAVLEDAYYAPAAYNYKALFADSGKNVIAFLTDKKGDSGGCQRVYMVEDGALVEAVCDSESLADDYHSLSDYRNLYIGEKLYLVRAGLVIVYDMTDGFAKVAELELE